MVESLISKKQIPRYGCLINSGYYNCQVHKSGQNGQSWVFVHRFVWECYNGVIQDGKVIDYEINIKTD